MQEDLLMGGRRQTLTPQRKGCTRTSEDILLPKRSEKKRRVRPRLAMYSAATWARTPRAC